MKREAFYYLIVVVVALWTKTAAQTTAGRHDIVDLPEVDTLPTTTVSIEAKKGDKYTNPPTTLSEDPDEQTTTSTSVVSPTTDTTTSATSAQAPTTAQGSTTTGATTTEATSSLDSPITGATTTQMAAGAENPVITEPTGPTEQHWELRDFDVTINLRENETVQSFFESLYLSMSIYFQEKYQSMTALELFVQELSDNILSFSGNVVFVSGNVQHSVEIWETQQYFLQGFLVENKSNGVASIMLENGVIIGQQPITTTTAPPAESQEDSAVEALSRDVTDAGTRPTLTSAWCKLALLLLGMLAF